MRVGLECDKAVLVQVVNDPLHVLAISAQVARAAVRAPARACRRWQLEDANQDVRQPEDFVSVGTAAYRTPWNTTGRVQVPTFSKSLICFALHTSPLGTGT
jgi:hypothetical protein